MKYLILIEDDLFLYKVDIESVRVLYKFFLRFYLVFDKI